MTKIACVILPTFNGEKYFLQQINSIISQEMPAGWHLKILIADDGSTDNTIQVIKEKENQESNIIKFVTFQDKNLGPRRIFEKLGELSLELNPDLLLFSDQDDFWLPGKIQKTIKLMSNVDTTAVYLGSAMITDADLTPLIKIPKHNLKPEFPSILLSNQRPGMTMALNGKALSEWVNNIPLKAVMHDWWVQQLLILKDATLIIDSEAFVLYRQHGKNALGIPRGIKDRAQFLKNHQLELFELRSLQCAELIKFAQFPDMRKNTQKVANLINKDFGAIVSLLQIVFDKNFFLNRSGADIVLARLYLVFSFIGFWVKGNEDK